MTRPVCEEIAKALERLENEFRILSDPSYAHKTGAIAWREAYSHAHECVLQEQQAGYLAPAAETEGCTSCGYPSLYQGGCTNCGASAAPAGDGGLREALEELASEIDTGSRATVNREAKGWQERTARRLRDVLAAHPAAPAVPQPVDREALAIQIRKHTLFPADEVETRETCACGWRPTGNPMLAYSEHARHVADELAVLAALNPAVPQPVDRERVAEVLHESDWRFNHGWKESGRCGEAHREQFYVQADALFDAGLLVGPCCAASAGDGGLREALEKLADDAVPLNGVEWVSAARLRDLLAAHSAAPAVPHGPYTEQETTN